MPAEMFKWITQVYNWTLGCYFVDLRVLFCGP